MHVLFFCFGKKADHIFVTDDVLEDSGRECNEEGQLLRYASKYVRQPRYAKDHGLEFVFSVFYEVLKRHRKHRPKNGAFWNTHEECVI
jgi:hypothetical protein